MFGKAPKEGKETPGKEKQRGPKSMKSPWDRFKKVVEEGSKKAMRRWEEFKENAKPVVKDVKEKGKTMFEKAMEEVKEQYPMVKKNVMEATSKVKEAVREQGEKVEPMAKVLAGIIGFYVKKGAKPLQEAMKEVSQAAKSGGVKLYETVGELGAKCCPEKVQELIEKTQKEELKEALKRGMEKVAEGER